MEILIFNPKVTNLFIRKKLCDQISPYNPQIFLRNPVFACRALTLPPFVPYFKFYFLFFYVYFRLCLVKGIR